MTAGGRRPWPAVFLLLLALVSLAAGPTADPLSERQWHLPHVGVPDAWSGGRANGIVVAVVDTGVDTAHPDLHGRLIGGIDLVDPGTAPDDPNGHGTLVAGIVAAVADNGVGVAGAAPLAQIMPVRVLDADGQGSSRTVAEGIRWAARNGAHVINLSLAEAPGQLSGVDALINRDVEAAIREAAEAGAFVVAAAGNEGRERTPYAADVPVLVVGATDRDDLVWAYSNRGGSTLYAPGVEIVSTYRGGGYAMADGTSFAAPIVSAAAAILREVGGDATQTREWIDRSAVDIGAGAGRLDMAAAVRAATAPPQAAPQTQPPAPSPPPAPPTAQSPPQQPPPESPPPPHPSPRPPVPLEEPQPVAVPTAREPVVVQPAPASSPDGWETPTEVAAAPDPPVEDQGADEAVASIPVAGGGPARGWPVAVAAALLAFNVAGLGVVGVRGVDG